MGLAVGEPAADRRADARARTSGRRRRGRRSRAGTRRPARNASASRITRSIPWRSMSLIVKTRTPSSRDQRPLAVVERAGADDRRALDRRRRPGVGRERRRRPRRAPRRAASRGRSRSARCRAGSCRRARRSRARRRRRAPSPSRRACPSRPSGRRRARAAGSPAPRASRDARRDLAARAHDRAEVAGLRVADLGRLGDAGLDVAPVDALAAEAGDPLLQPRVADRRGPHVDAAAARARGRDRRRSPPRAVSLPSRHGARLAHGGDG